MGFAARDKIVGIAMQFQMLQHQVRAGQCVSVQER